MTKSRSNKQKGELPNRCEVGFTLVADPAGGAWPIVVDHAKPLAKTGRTHTLRVSKQIAYNGRYRQNAE